MRTLQPLGAEPEGLSFPDASHTRQLSSDRKELDWRASDLFKWLGTGELKLHIQKTSSLLADGAQAHRDLESRKTTGKLLLKPKENSSPPSDYSSDLIKARRSAKKDITSNQDTEAAAEAVAFHIEVRGI